MFSIPTIFLLTLHAIQASEERTTRLCPIKADLWVLGGQSNMCILGYRNLQNCGELDHPVQLDRQRIRAFGLDNEWTDPIEPVHWFYTAAAPILRQTTVNNAPTCQTRSLPESGPAHARECSGRSVQGLLLPNILLTTLTGTSA